MADFEVSLGLNTRQFQRDLAKIQQTAKGQVAQAFQGLRTGTLVDPSTTKALGDQGRAAEKVSKSVKDLGGNARRAGAGLKQMSAGAKRASTAQAALNSNTRRGNQGFVTQIFLASKWVIAYGGIFTLLTSVRREMSETVKQTIRFNKSQIELTRLLRGTSEELTGVDRLFAGAARQAEFFSFNMDEVLETMKDFKLQGRDVTEVLLLTEASLAGARIGFLGVSQVARAVSAIINAMGASAGFATEAIDIMNEVTKSSAIDFGQLSQAIRTSILPARQAGATFQELNGIIAAISEATRKTGTEIGTALRSIFVFFRRPETVNAIQNLTAGIEGLDLRVIDAQGNVRDFLDVLQDLIVETRNFSEENQRLIVTALGSTRRQADVLAIFERFETVLKQTVRGLSATGKAQDDVKLTTQALEAGITRLRVEIQRTTLRMEGPLVIAIQSTTKFLTNLAAAFGTAEFRAKAFQAGVFLVLVRTLQKTGPLLLALIQGLRAATVGILAYTGFVIGAARATGALNVSIGALLTSTGFFRVAILATVAILTLFGNSIGEAERKTRKLADVVTKRMEDMRQSVERLQGQLDAAGERIATLENLADRMERLEAAGDNPDAIRFLQTIREEFKKLDIEVRTSADLRQLILNEVVGAEFRVGIAQNKNREGLERVNAELKNQAINLDGLQKREEELRLERERLRDLPPAADLPRALERADEIRSLDERILLTFVLQAQIQEQLTEAEKEKIVLKEQSLKLELAALQQIEEQSSASLKFLEIRGKLRLAQGDFAREEGAILATLEEGVNAEAIADQIKTLTTTFENQVRAIVKEGTELQESIKTGTIPLLDQWISTQQRILTLTIQNRKEDEAELAVLRLHNDLIEGIALSEARAAEQREKSKRKLEEQIDLIALRRSGLVENEVVLSRIADLNAKIAAAEEAENAARAEADRFLAAEGAHIAEIANKKERGVVLSQKEADILNKINLTTAVHTALLNEQNSLKARLEGIEDRNLERAERILENIKLQLIASEGTAAGLSRQEISLQRIEFLQDNLSDDLQDQARLMKEILGLQAQWDRDVRQFADFFKNNVVSSISDVAFGIKEADDAAKDLVKTVGKRILDNALNALFSLDPFKKFFISLGESFTTASAGWAAMLQGENADFFAKYNQTLNEFIVKLEALQKAGRAALDVPEDIREPDPVTGFFETPVPPTPVDPVTGFPETPVPIPETPIPTVAARTVAEAVEALPEEVGAAVGQAVAAAVEPIVAPQPGPMAVTLVSPLPLPVTLVQTTAAVPLATPALRDTDLSEVRVTLPTSAPQPELVNALQNLAPTGRAGAHFHPEFLDTINQLATPRDAPPPVTVPVLPTPVPEVSIPTEAFRPLLDPLQAVEDIPETLIPQEDLDALIAAGELTAKNLSFELNTVNTGFITEYGLLMDDFITKLGVTFEVGQAIPDEERFTPVPPVARALESLAPEDPFADLATSIDALPETLVPQQTFDEIRSAGKAVFVPLAQTFGATLGAKNAIFIKDQAAVLAKHIVDLRKTLQVPEGEEAVAAAALPPGIAEQAPPGEFLPPSTAPQGPEEKTPAFTGADIVNTILAASSIFLGGGQTGTQIGAVVGGIVGGFLGKGPQGAQAGIGVGSAFGSLFDEEPTTETVTRTLLDVPSKLDLSNQELVQVNRNLVALRETLDPFALPSSFFFRERPGTGVQVQNLTINDAGNVNEAFEGLARGGLV